jgi:hypothetical protein
MLLIIVLLYRSHARPVHAVLLLLLLPAAAAAAAAATRRFRLPLSCGL